MVGADRNLIAVSGLGDLQVFSSLGADNPFPDFPCVPPDTGNSEQIAGIDRGENMHGTLFQDFYFCTNESDDPSHYVLWLGEGGDQFDDGQARIYPGAFTDISPFYDDNGEANTSLAAAVLLYRCLREVVFSWGADHYDEDTICKGGKLYDYGQTKLSNEQVLVIFHCALQDEPFKFL
jgi:hypothetical protein